MLDPAERGAVLDALLIAHPDLNDEAEHIANGLLTAASVEPIATDLEAPSAWISLDALAARAGGTRGRGYGLDRARDAEMGTVLAPPGTTRPRSSQHRSSTTP